jgi:hypothetical protein
MPVVSSLLPLLAKPLHYTTLGMVSHPTAFYCQNKVLRRFRDSQAAKDLFSLDEAPIKPVHR